MRLGLVFLLSAVLVKSTYAVELPKLLQEVEQKYTKQVTLEVSFVQVNTSATFSKKTTTSGVIRIKRPDKVRWETLKPDSDMNLMVSDGRKFWFYTPPFDEGEHGQVIERKSAQVQSQLAQALLSGTFSKAKGMSIKQNSESRFTLVPKKGTAGTVTKAEIQVDPDKKLITKVTLSNEGGNRSEITLSNIELGKPLGDEYFSFEPPPNTDRIKN